MLGLALPPCRPRVKAAGRAPTLDDEHARQSGLPTRTDGRFQKVTRTNIYSIHYIPIKTYTFLIIYSNKRILFLIIYLNMHILHSSYPDLIIYAIRYMLISLYTFVVTYTFLIIYLNKHIVYSSYNRSIIYIPDYMLISSYTFLII